MKRSLSIIQSCLQAFISLGALAGGAVLIISPDGSLMKMPLSSLHASPFSDFLVPGIILFTVNGLGHAAAAVLSARRHPLAGLAGMAFGLGLMIWIFVQVNMIGGGHWLQYTYFALGVGEVGLSRYQ